MNTINFEYNGRPYKLGFSRESVRALERTGFNIDHLSDMPATMIPELFYGAFALYHRGIKRKLVEEMLEQMERKNDLILALAELYAETISDLLSDGDEEENPKKIAWEVSQ